MSGLGFITALDLASCLAALGHSYATAVESTQGDGPIRIESLSRSAQCHIFLLREVTTLVQRVANYASNHPSLFTADGVHLIRDGENGISDSLKTLAEKDFQPTIAESMRRISSEQAFLDELRQTDLFKRYVDLRRILGELPDVDSTNLPSIRMKLPDEAPSQALCYDPLETKSTIRIVRMDSRSLEYGSEMQLSFRHVDLSDSPQYATLSYTWGNPFAVFQTQEDRDTAALKDIPITCNGQVLEVEENLYRFMSRWQVALTVLDERLKKGDLSEVEMAMCPPAEFWIDAICINQKDDLERNHQVSIMAEIYSKCDRTWVWLGEEDAFSRKALQTLQSLATAANKLPVAQASQLEPRVVCEMLELPSLFSWHWFSVFALLQRAWFQRSWVVQEAVLSPRLEFFCGSLLFPWIAMVGACHYMSRSGMSNMISSFAALEMAPTGRQFLFDDNVTSVVRVEEFDLDPAELHLYASRELNKELPMGSLVLSIANARHADGAVRLQDASHPGVSWESSTKSDEKSTGALTITPDQRPSSSILELWQLSRLTKCFDPRDKVYAFIHLANRPCYTSSRTNEARKYLDVHYELTVKEVYLKAAWFTLLSDSNLDLLCTARSKSALNRHDLPSWVPDWSDEPDIMEYRVMAERIGWSAAGATEWRIPATSDLYQPQLRVQCVFVDSVRHTTAEEFDYSAAVLLAGLLPAEYQGVGGGPSPMEVLWRTMVCDYDSRTHPAPESTGKAFEFAYWDTSRERVRANVMSNTDPGLYKTFMASAKIMKKYGYERPELDSAAEVESEEEKSLKNQVSEYEGQRRRLLHSRKLLLTDSGYFGVGDQRVREGDKVVLVGGVRTPLVLRPGSDGRYFLIGEAYFHGIMHGEFLEQHNVDFEEIILA